MSSQKAPKPAERRDLVDFMRQEHGLSIRRVCLNVSLSLTVFSYRAKPKLAQLSTKVLTTSNLGSVSLVCGK